MDNSYKIEIDSISKRFNRLRLFKDLSFSLKTGDSMSISGSNGSGKSTLMQIIAGLQSPDKGKVTYSYNGKELLQNIVNTHIGFSSPLLNLYEELTGIENIHFALRKPVEKDKITSMLELFKLENHRNKSVKYYSSGMKQRLKFIASVINDPVILFLDEPGTNLDKEGKELIYSYIKKVKKDKIIVIATNEEDEAALCREDLKLGK